MKIYSQYGEEYLLKEVFGEKRNGLCVEIGAADGIRYSNSRFLIEQMNWRAILVEPHPDFFRSLTSLYADNDRIELVNAAVSDIVGYAELHLYGRDLHAQVSTICEKQAKKVIMCHGDSFIKETERVVCTTLDKVLGDHIVDFLSIDAEGVDMKVLQSNDWTRNRPYLLCVEHSMEEKELLDYAISINYRKIHKNTGNTFFIDNAR